MHMHLRNELMLLRIIDTTKCFGFRNAVVFVCDGGNDVLHVGAL